MKKGLAWVALSALVVAAPAAAEKVFIPVLGNAAADGSALGTQVRAAGGQVLAKLAPTARVGLIPLESEGSALEVSAWAVDREGRDAYEVPVFSEAETYRAGLDVQLDKLPAALSSLTVGAANLSEQTAFCQATLFGRNEKQLGTVPFQIEPMGLAREDALAATGLNRAARVSVSCDQTFYPFAVAGEPGGATPFIAKATGPNGTCTKLITLARENDGTFAVSVPGLFHTATRSTPKGILCIRAGSDIMAGKAVFEWDSTAGPWSSRNKSGLHNLGYFFLERFRSGTVGNINIAGPNKSFFKIAQNVNMAPPANTNQKAGYAMQTGATYHYVYTFDARNKSASLVVSLNGAEIKRLSMEARPGNNQTLILEPYGSGNLAGLALVAEFGNLLGQHHPEEASIGWKFSNFKLTVTPK